mmetsp:Transcript_1624/g.4464  ORF Transcript_1624/g.4464 Transcript_1624/m.4464 type:complete len:233 (+) Transcript_1624:723-1421(+)
MSSVWVSESSPHKRISKESPELYPSMSVSSWLHTTFEASAASGPLTSELGRPSMAHVQYARALLEQSVCFKPLALRKMILTTVRSSTCTTCEGFPLTASCTLSPIFFTTLPFTSCTVVNVCPTLIALDTVSRCCACSSGVSSCFGIVECTGTLTCSSGDAEELTFCCPRSAIFMACASSATTMSKVLSYSSLRLIRCSPPILFQLMGFTPLPTRKARYVGSSAFHCCGSEST